MERALTTMKKAVELSPRNDHYLFNLASLYMANHKPDEAISVLQSLTQSGEPGLSVQAQKLIEEARQYKEYLARKNSPSTMAFNDASPPGGEREPAPAPAPIHPGVTHFIKGKIVEVECGAQPGAIVSVSSSGKVWKLHVRDRQHVILIGSDQFSCDWKNLPIAANFRDAGEPKANEGDVISLELQ